MALLAWRCKNLDSEKIGAPKRSLEELLLVVGARRVLFHYSGPAVLLDRGASWVLGGSERSTLNIMRTLEKIITFLPGLTS